MTHRPPFTQALRRCALALWLLLLLPLSSLAGTVEGVNWLATQQQANGSFGATPAMSAESGPRGVL